VRAVFPECKFIHLYRDGRDVTADARLCWQSSMWSNRIQPKQDLIKKAINFPLTAAWPYLLNYISTYATRLVSKEKHVKSWGPRFKGIDGILKVHSLLEVCGIQWSKSVELSLKALLKLKENVDYINVRYEDLVREPIRELHKIIDFLKVTDYKSILEYGEKNISDEYVGFAKQILTPDELEELNPHVSLYLSLLDYI
jgi:hypothetical protein